MALHELTNGKLVPIKEDPFPLERDLQKLIENNLGALLGLELASSEFAIKNRRIDTLAYDKDSQAFVIIEYKRNKNYSVIDQGMAYLQLMLDNKAEFIVEYNERKGGALKRSDVDWSQSRLIFVAPGFTQDQREACNFKDLNIELLEVKRHVRGLFSITHHTTSASAPSFKEVASQADGAGSVKEELRSYSEEEHFRNGSPEVVDLYEKLKAGIMNLGDNIEIVPRKQFIGFKEGKIFTSVVFQKKGLKVVLNAKWGTLSDPKGLASDVRSIGHWGNGEYRIELADDVELEYSLSLIKQAYKKEV
jgi:predicted transport protein